jgi:hypothetical protein
MLFDMLFNRENYELFVLDFLDGKLSPGDRELFAGFLNDHPDILEEVMNIEQIRLLPGDISYPDKDLLKKSSIDESVHVSTAEFNNYCIAYLENDLSLTEKKDFEGYLEENPHKREELESFRKVYLKPDMSIEFTSKSKLKKLTISRRSIRIISLFSSAAAILILVMILAKPDVSSFKQLITGRDQPGDTRNEITSADDHLMENAKDLPVQLNEPDSRERREEYNVQKISGIQPEHTEINTGDQNFPVEDLGTHEEIELSPISSLMASIEVQTPDLPDRLLTFSQRNAGNSMRSEEYLTVIEFTEKRLIKDLIQKADDQQEDHLTLWDLAYAGFNGLDKISESNFKLNREIDNNGSIKRIIVETPLVGFSLPLKGNESIQ